MEVFCGKETFTLLDYYSMQLFSPAHDNFNPAASFEYWTAIAVTTLK
jgi:hypothetical protein